MKYPLALLGSLSLAAIPHAFAQADNDYAVFGVTFFGNELVRIDPSTGQGSLVGPLGATVSPFGLASRNGALYTFNATTSQIQPIDATTGQVGAGIGIGVSGVQGEGDLAFSPNGTGFLFAALDSSLNVVNNLYKFDITSGTSTRLGSSSLTLDGLAFSGNLLFATAQGDGNLYLVNQNDASLFPVGSLGINPDSPFQGLTATPDGMLIGAINDRAYRIDPFTGAATALDANGPDIGFSSVSGIAVIPEPATMSLVACGAGLMWLMSRRAK